jgi:predicted PurR-regulated permease PerM
MFAFCGDRHAGSLPDRRVPVQLVSAISITVCGALRAGQGSVVPIALALVLAVLLAPLCRLLEMIWAPPPLAAGLSLVTARFVALLVFSHDRRTCLAA